MVSGLETGDGGLVHAELACERRLGQAMLDAVADYPRGHSVRECGALVLGPDCGVA